MEFIPMNILEYKFDEDGITTQITVAFQKYQGSEQFSSRITLTQEYVQSINEKMELDRMNKAQIERFARVKLRDWILVERKAEDEATE